MPHRAPTARHLLVAATACVVVAAAFALIGHPRPRADVEPAKRPSDWAWVQRTYPHFDADADAYLAAVAQARLLRAVSKAGPALGAWQPVGPTNVGGRVSDVAFDPLHPDTFYVAAATGGVFRTRDGGERWAPVFDEQAVLPIGDLAVSPSDPRVLYVGTGEANGGHNNLPGGGVFRSRDGGDTWTPLGLESTTSIGRIVVDPTDDGRVFVAATGSYFRPNAERGVYRTLDGGDTWAQVLHVNDSTGVIDLVMRPGDPDVLVAAAWERVRYPNGGTHLHGPSSGLYRTFDGGDTWDRLGAAHGLPEDAATGRIGLAACASAPRTMYALYTENHPQNGYTYRSLYRTDDGGDTWRDADSTRAFAQGFGTFSWYFGQVRCHPTDPERVYVLDIGFMRSSDGGATLDRSHRGHPQLHVDHHALAFHPHDAAVIVSGNDGGINVSTDGGATWAPRARLPITQFYEVGVDPSNPDRLYGGTQDNGTIRTGGRADGWHEIFGGDGFYVLIHPTDPDVIYAESQNGNLGKSTDGGQTWQSVRPPGTSAANSNWSTPVVMAPDDPQTLYYGADRVFRTTDGAATWAPISPALTRPTSVGSIGTITTMAVAPSDPARLYAGTGDGNVWTTPDGGETWALVSDGLPHRWVTRLAADPRDARTAYVTFSGLKWREPTPHVFKTTDAGQTWHDVSAGLPDAPANVLAIDPDAPDVLYLGTDVGPFVSFHGGDGWEPLGTGMPAVAVYDLDVIDGERRLVAGTHGRSMYTLDLAGLPLAAETAGVGPARIHFSAPYPNPFREAVTLEVSTDAPTTVEVAVYDVLGRRVRLLHHGPLASGIETIRWDGRDAGGRPVAAGTYFARLSATTPDGRATLRTRTLTLAR